MLKAFKAMVVRDLKLYAKNPFDCARPLIFFVMVASLFPMLTRFMPSQLSELAPAIIWIAIVLAMILSLENILAADFEDGSLDELLISPFPLAWLLFGKLLAHWIAVLLPLFLLAPLLGFTLNLPLSGFKGLMATLAVGLPTLSLMTAMLASLIVGLRQGGVFLALLALPLMLPVLLFGTSGTMASSLGLPFLGELALLSALFFLMIILGPMTMAYVLRMIAR